MKKLVAILLALACMFSIVACGGTGEDGEPSISPESSSEAQKILDSFAELIRTSDPNKSYVTTETGSKDISLFSSQMTQKGELSGKEAAISVYFEEQLNEVGAYEPKTEIRETKEYVEGMGLRINGGSWDATQLDNFVRKIQPYRINLDATLIKGLLVNEEQTVITFVVPKDNVGDVFDKFNASALTSINSDVTVRIETDGASVTVMELEYAAKSVAHMENPTVKIRAEYDYSLQGITLLK